MTNNEDYAKLTIKSEKEKKGQRGLNLPLTTAKPPMPPVKPPKKENNNKNT